MTDAEPSQAAADPLMSTDGLAGRLGQPEWVVFDATMPLPGEPWDAQAAFERARIPGARRFDIDAIADPEATLPHMAPGAARFARLLGEWGVSNRSQVVFYDAHGLFSAARGWWLMRLFGHDAVWVLEGGLPAWRREHRPLESGPAAPPPPARFEPALRTSWLRGLGDMRDNLRTGRELVLDARAAGRFAATQPEPRPGLRGGHIPGSRSLPYNDLLRPDGTMLPPAVLRARFAAAGVGGGRTVVTSCGTGITAAILSLGLVRAGFDPGALYDGSWTEWAGRAELPVEI